MKQFPNTYCDFFEIGKNHSILSFIIVRLFHIQPFGFSCALTTLCPFRTRKTEYIIFLFSFIFFTFNLVGFHVRSLSNTKTAEKSRIKWRLLLPGASQPRSFLRRNKTWI